MSATHDTDDEQPLTTYSVGDETVICHRQKPTAWVQSTEAVDLVMVR